MWWSNWAGDSFIYWKWNDWVYGFWNWDFWWGFGIVVQLTEDWGETLFAALSRAGGKAFSNMAVGYNNVDVNAANKYGVAVGNTPVSSKGNKKNLF